MATGRFLLVDNSNSFTKIALASGESILKTRKLPTRGLTPAAFQRALAGWTFDRVVLSSVVPEIGAVIAQALAPHPILHVGAKVKLGVGIDYPKPKTIGA